MCRLCRETQHKGRFVAGDNHAAERGDSRDGINCEAIESVLHQSMVGVRAIIEQLAGCKGIKPT